LVDDVFGCAKSFLGADAEAVVWLRRSIDAQRNLPFTHFNLAAALAQLGRLDEAQAAARAGLALDPSFTLRRFRLNAALPRLVEGQSGRFIGGPFPALYTKSC
jgi:tetratricopeptide (TPR) repeat protein